MEPTFQEVQAGIAWTAFTDAMTGDLRARAVRQLPDGLPFLVSMKTQDVVEAALAFVDQRYVVRGLPSRPTRLRHSSNTREACVRDLKDFYDFMDAVRVKPGELTPAHIESYASSMFRASPATGKPYSRNTIVRRMQNIRAFVLWLQQDGRLACRFPVEDLVIGRRTVSSIVAGRTYGQHERDDTINFMTFDEARAILSALGPLPSAHAASPRNASSRFRLAAEIVLNTGLRRAEVAGLLMAELAPALQRTRGDDYVLIPVRLLGKGRVWRRVLFPSWLLKEIQQYIEGERHLALESRHARATFGCETLIVNPASSRTRPGLPTNPASIWQAYRKAQPKLKMEGRIDRTFRFHDLRHTYAIWTWIERKRAGDRDPVKYIQSQLGHTSRETTETIYLKAVTLFEAQIYGRAYQKLEHEVAMRTSESHNALCDI
ncbi:Phage integrase family protein [Luteibacter sp. UNCMF331Sha3.1]|uniref:tyrosine-type recombinase/integrase n=1 Tax=Luteibacter sp. UNCMF331Sha3.1 TaxID=1502760 RepID=UPI0008C7165B|nr:tyrosine-type recombinase/integrase [Luteibacter sp. UNCMF331Sha3.1]SEM54609.1 Phage integrase family protein [Luteibacter sp. UNCMF331Sha3.1]